MQSFGNTRLFDDHISFFFWFSWRFFAFIYRNTRSNQNLFCVSRFDFICGLWLAKLFLSSVQDPTFLTTLNIVLVCIKHQAIPLVHLRRLHSIPVFRRYAGLQRHFKSNVVAIYMTWHFAQSLLHQYDTESKNAFLAIFERTLKLFDTELLKSRTKRTKERHKIEFPAPSHVTRALKGAISALPGKIA